MATDDEFFLSPKDIEAKTQKQIEDNLYNTIMNKPLMTGWDILSFPSEPNDYLIENFLWRGSIGFVIGQEKACKSIFTTQKGMAMTCGEPFLQAFDVAKPLKVLYIQAEGDMGETKDRFISATREGGIKWNPDNWRHFAPAALALDTDLGYDELVERIHNDGFKPDVIIIDPLYMAMEGDLIDNKAVRHFCRNIRRLKNEFECAIIVVHHEKRPLYDKAHKKIDQGDNSIFGSSMLKNFASHVLRISITNKRGNDIAPEKEENEPIKYRKVACATQRNGNVIKKVMLKLVEEPLQLEVVDCGADGNTAEMVLNAIKFKGSASATDVVATSSMGETTVRKCFSRLKKDGKIVVDRKEGKYVYYKVVD